MIIEPKTLNSLERRNIQTVHCTTAGAVCRGGLKITGLIKFLSQPTFTTKSKLN